MSSSGTLRFFSRWRSGLAVCTGLICGMVLFASTAVSAAPVEDQTVTAAQGALKCSEHTLPVRLSDPGEATERIWGELCYRGSSPPKTVQLLVPGATLGSYYFDFPFQPEQYSYVRSATAAGYATFNIDRVGTGKSSHPSSDLLSVRTEAVSVHDVISALRAGKVAGHAFSRVVYIGHSLGGAIAWFEASQYRDVDAVAITGEMHTINTPVFNSIQVHQANQDPRFAGQGLDDGYLTTVPGGRGVFYFEAKTDPRVAAIEESLKETATPGEFDVGLLNRPPVATAPSQGIRVPTLVLVGDKDTIWCGNDGLKCDSAASVRDFESQYYTGAPKLQVTVLKNIGHCMAIHEDAQRHNKALVDWAQQVVKPN